MTNRTIATPPGQPTEHKKLTSSETRKLKQDHAKIHEKLNTYDIYRRRAYPSIEEQLDMIFHKGIFTWRKEIEKIKKKFPKPE